MESTDPLNDYTEEKNPVAGPSKSVTAKASLNTNHSIDLGDPPADVAIEAALPGGEEDTEEEQAIRLPFGIPPIFLLTIMVIYSALLGAHFFNWTPWVEILNKSGAFKEFCRPDELTCPAMDEKIAALLCIATLLMFAFTLIGGFILDSMGPKICSAVGNSLLIIAWIFLMFAPKVTFFYYLSFALMGAGSDPAFFGTLSMAQLYPKKSSIVISVLGGARSLANCWPLIFKLLKVGEPDHLSFQNMCIIYLVVYILTLVFIVVPLLPKVPYYLAGKPKTDTEEVQEPLIMRFRKTAGREVSRLGTYMIQLPFLSVVVITICNIIRNNFYLTTAPSQLSTGAQDVLSYINAFAWIPGPICGVIVQIVGPLAVILGLNISNILVFCALLLGETVPSTNDAMGYTSTVFALPIIGFLLSQIYCYIAVVYPPADLGKLAGIASCIAGLVGLSVPSMMKFSVDRKSFWEMNMVCILIGFVSLTLIFYLWLINGRSKKTVER